METIIFILLKVLLNLETLMLPRNSICHSLRIKFRMFNYLPLLFHLLNQIVWTIHMRQRIHSKNPIPQHLISRIQSQKELY